MDSALPKPMLVSKKREQEWLESLPRGMVDITGNRGESSGEDGEGQRQREEEERREEEELKRLQEVERRDLKVQEEEEEAWEVTEEPVGQQEGSEKKDGHDEDEGSLLGGVSLGSFSLNRLDEGVLIHPLVQSATTPSHRSFGATTVLSSSDSSSVNRSTSVSRQRRQY